MGIGIEKLAIEIEEIANGVYPSKNPQNELLIAKAKRIQQLARRRKSVPSHMETLIYSKCDLRMMLDEASRKYRVFAFKNCGNRVGGL